MRGLPIGVLTLMALVFGFAPPPLTCWAKAALGDLDLSIQAAQAQAAQAQADASEPVSRPRQYAPDRQADILSLVLDVTPDFHQRTVSGTVHIRFKPIARPLEQLKLDAVDLHVRSIRSSQKIQAYQTTAESIQVQFEKPIPAAEESTIDIEYTAQPEKGLYFRTPEMGYPDGETQVFSQGEAIEARHWYPSYDNPNEKFASEVICHVPEGMVALSNGTLVSQEKDANSGLVTFHWKEQKPHVNYLISLVAGYFKKVEDRYRDIPMAFWVSPSDMGEAPSSFRETKEAMRFFEKEIGMPYPWEKYDQVTVKDFMFGGMENVSITTLTDRTLFTSASENIRTSEGLISHELAHQWFGDLVTCKDWSQIWLNESFATFYAHLFEEHQHGRDSMLYSLWAAAQGLTTGTVDTRPVVYRKFSDPEDLFRQLGHLVYAKGGWVLHMLRHQLGPDLYRKCIRTYLERHQFNTVVTEDLIQVVEELSGRSYDRFFDQWIFHGGVPELKVDYSWDAKSRLAKISVAQTQKVTDAVLLFEFPLELRFKGDFGTVDRQVELSTAAQDFYVALPSAPKIVRIDPNLAVLAKVEFRPPDAMLLAQAGDETDVIGRVLAIRQLAEKPSHEAIERLRDRLQKDPFYGVRAEASRALAQIHSEESFQALAESTAQPDARVRQQVAGDLGVFYSDAAYRQMLNSAKSEKNPEILARLIPALAGYSRDEVRTLLTGFLKSNSYRNQLVDAAIRGIRSRDDPSLIEPLLDTLKSRRAVLTSETLAQGLETLGQLGRAENNKDLEREFLLDQAQDKRKLVQVAAITALGNLRDRKAAPMLEKFAVGEKNSAVRTAAEKALSDVRSAEKAPEAVTQLRKEILDLQKQNQELRKDINDLKNKMEAAPGPPTDPAKTNRK